MLVRANNTRQKSHETSSADCTLRPRGNAIVAVGPFLWGILEKTNAIATLHAARRRLSESRMRENLTYGLMWQGVETRTSVSGATP